jgi:hypothetical protein
MLLCAATLTALLVIGRVEQNPGPGVDVENSLQILYSGCERNLKSGTMLVPQQWWKCQDSNGRQREM